MKKLIIISVLAIFSLTGFSQFQLQDGKTFTDTTGHVNNSVYGEIVNINIEYASLTYDNSVKFELVVWISETAKDENKMAIFRRSYELLGSDFTAFVSAVLNGSTGAINALEIWVMNNDSQVAAKLERIL